MQFHTCLAGLAGRVTGGRVAGWTLLEDRLVPGIFSPPPALQPCPTTLLLESGALDQLALSDGEEQQQPTPANSLRFPLTSMTKIP